MAEMALATQDYDILQDLRELNGRQKNEAFDVFWDEMQSLLESHACVDDRRHGKSKHYAWSAFCNCYAQITGDAIQ